MTKIDEEEIAKISDEIINKIEKFFMTGKGMCIFGKMTYVIQ